jgi:tetratricopeptide (TPR) repeat protein
MARGLLLVSLIAASALLGFTLEPGSALAHDDRPHPILRIDERLARATEIPLSERRQARLLLRRARFSRQNGALAAALADLKHAGELGAKGRLMSYERGLTLALLEHDAEALPELDRFLATGRPNAIALNARARIHERSGRFELALADYSASVALRDDVEIYLARGRVLSSLERCDDAATGYRAGLARIGRAEALEKALVAALSACGKHDAALAAVDAHLRSGRATTDWFLLRGDVIEAAGDAAGARTAREHALANAEQALSHKKTAILYYERARAHVALGNVQQARLDLERVLSAAGTFEPAIELAKAVQLAAGDGIPDRESGSGIDASASTARTNPSTTASPHSVSDKQKEMNHASSGGQ